MLFIYFYFFYFNALILHIYFWEAEYPYYKVKGPKLEGNTFACWLVVGPNSHIKISLSVYLFTALHRQLFSQPALVYSRVFSYIVTEGWCCSN